MRSPRAVVGAALVAVLVSTGSPAYAQQSSQIDVQTFRPAPHALGGFAVDSARTLPHLGWSVGLFTNYANDPLRLKRIDTGGTIREYVSDQVTSNLLFAIGFFDLLEVDLDLPVFLFNDGAGLPGGEELSVAGLGDLRITPRVRFLDGVFGLGLAVDLEAPTGSRDTFMSSGVFRVATRLNVHLDFEAIRFLLNAAIRFQGLRELDNLDVDHELLLGFATVVPFAFGLDLVGEATTYTRLQAPFERQNETGLEIRGGLRYRTPIDLVLAAGAGPGILPGYGTPDWRVFFGLFYAPTERDRDGDGLEDREDGCPDVPEDRDGFEDADGCPDPDDDLDGVLDEADRCRRDPEDRDAFEDEDGCPDPDNDRDGVLDTVDACPLAPEDMDNFEDLDGCPDPDNDKDGVLDAADQCPLQAETANAYQDEDGCPDRKLVELQCERILILDKIYFEYNRAVIDPISFPLLDQVADTMLQSSFIRRVQVEGHTDSQGPTKYNRDLSQKRAQAVVNYLVARGVPRSALSARGYGESLPIDSNMTEEGRSRNRRVEFTIMDQGARPECR